MLLDNHQQLHRTFFEQYTIKKGYEETTMSHIS